MSLTFIAVEKIKQDLRNLKHNVVRHEEDEQYREYCEGIIDSAISALGIIRP